MKIDGIEIENFRNIEHLQTPFEETNIIYGENAQGKTNLLEALYLFCGARTFRKAKDFELKRFGTEQAKIKIDFENSIRKETAEIVIRDRREATLNGIKQKSPVDLSKEIKVVMFSPDHLNLIKEGPRERRNFADTALCQLKGGYRNVLNEYNRALKQRNSLIKNSIRDPKQNEMLPVWDETLCENGAKIIYQREKYLEALSPIVKSIFFGISNNREEIEIGLQSEIEDRSSIGAIKDQLLEKMQENAEKDVITGTTNAGPHRDDIEILINGKSARLYGSQGQQRSCVLALKLAEAQLLSEMTGEMPVALLDDVMSELDGGRQEYILNNIKAGQIFITCCDLSAVLRLKGGLALKMVGGNLIREEK